MKKLILFLAFLFLTSPVFADKAIEGELTVTGTVGIGTSSPQANLDIAGASPIAYIRNSDFNYGTSTGSGLLMVPNATSGNTTSTLQAFQQGNHAGASLLLNPSGGNVGIGTTSITGLITVGGACASYSGSMCFVNGAIGKCTGALGTCTACTAC